MSEDCECVTMWELRKIVGGKTEDLFPNSILLRALFASFYKYEDCTYFKYSFLYMVLCYVYYLVIFLLQMDIVIYPHQNILVIFVIAANFLKV